jgi:hypothetical protein
MVISERLSAARLATPVAALVLAFSSTLAAQSSGSWKLIAWNDLGMHCLDADFSVFAILPPYNVIHAQLLDPNGVLVDGSVYPVTYEAVADLAGSINRTSAGKTNFWDHVFDLFGQPLSVDQGLAGHDMPGSANLPQPMVYDATWHWYSAEGIPLTPWSDAILHNPYPMMRLLAHDAKGKVIAETRIVLPVSDEMDCSACHASDSAPAARPAAGWLHDPDPQRDYRLNILRLHDQLQLANPDFSDALIHRGFSATGLEATAVGGRAILCASCHPSNALAGSGLANLEPLTQAVHAGHAPVIDPSRRIPLGSSELRDACYRCHPGATTRCLRGAMGRAVAANGMLEIQCQGCHGAMADVGAPGRAGWLEEPTCQSCHTGTAVANSGQIRFTGVFTAQGETRLAADPTFATENGMPMAPYDLYRFSYGHGGLACEACHGSTHAIFPSSHANDNVQSVDLQGHVGMLSECSACHPTPPDGLTGPHGAHASGQSWVDHHGDWSESHGTSACRDCHGTDWRGTVLSASQSQWSASTGWGPRDLWRGFTIGCYLCHDGPGSESAATNHAPVATSRSASGPGGLPLFIPLGAGDADGDALTLRIVTGPRHGLVGLVGRLALLYPDPGWAGTDSFTFAAWDGKSDSNLATVSLTLADAGALFGDGFEVGSALRWSSTTP